MKLRTVSMLVLGFAVPWWALSARADTLGFANPYAVLAESGITNPTTFGNTVITGNMGLSPIAATACTGFAASTGCTLGPGTVTGTTDLTNANAASAIAAFKGAYTALANTPGAIAEGTATLGSGGSLSSLAPGVYSFTGATTNLIGTLTLAGDGKPNDLWIFQVAGQLTTATGVPFSPAASVVVNNAGTGAGVYFEVGSLATLGNDTAFEGNILAGSGVTLDPGAQITCGRAFAQTAVTFAGNDPAASGGQPNLVSIDNCSPGTGSTTGLNGGVPIVGAVTPEPGTFVLFSSGLLAMVFLMFRMRQGRQPVRV
jgi:hypothetical protein